MKLRLTKEQLNAVEKAMRNYERINICEFEGSDKMSCETRQEIHMKEVRDMLEVLINRAYQEGHSVGLLYDCDEMVQHTTIFDKE